MRTGLARSKCPSKSMPPPRLDSGACDEIYLADFVVAYHCARRLKMPRGLTPYEAFCKACGENPSQFTADPQHQLPGPDISSASVVWN